MTSDATHSERVRLYDIKARKGHLCQGGTFDLKDGPVCGCGARLDQLPDFMRLSPDDQRTFTVTGAVQPPVTVNDEPPWSTGDDRPPAPFTHANGEPCYGCQICFGNVLDDDPSDIDDGHSDPADLMAQADTQEAVGVAVQSAHDAPDMRPAVPVIDPSMPYGPAEVERAMLDANRRLELGLKHEANLVAATEQLKIEYELAYARAIERSAGGAADIRKANAVLASERQYRAWHEAQAARDAIRSVTHTLRSTLSALQSVSRSVGVSYGGPQGRGR